MSAAAHAGASLTDGVLIVAQHTRGARHLRRPHWHLDPIRERRRHPLLSQRGDRRNRLGGAGSRFFSSSWIRVPRQHIAWAPVAARVSQAIVQAAACCDYVYGIVDSCIPFRCCKVVQRCCNSTVLDGSSGEQCRVWAEVFCFNIVYVYSIHARSIRIIRELIYINYQYCVRE